MRTAAAQLLAPVHRQMIHLVLMSLQQGLIKCDLLRAIGDPSSDIFRELLLIATRILLQVSPTNIINCIVV
jgi:hypothetical protein